MALLIKDMTFIYPSNCHEMCLRCPYAIGDLVSVTAFLTYANSKESLLAEIDIPLGRVTEKRFGCCEDQICLILTDEQLEPCLDFPCFYISLVLDFGDCSCVEAYKVKLEKLCYFNRDVMSYLHCADGTELYCEDGCPIKCVNEPQYPVLCDDGKIFCADGTALRHVCSYLTDDC